MHTLVIVCLTSFSKRVSPVRPPGEEDREFTVEELPMPKRPPPPTRQLSSRPSSSSPPPSCPRPVLECATRPPPSLADCRILKPDRITYLWGERSLLFLLFGMYFFSF